MIPAQLSWLTRFVASVASMSCVPGAGHVDAVEPGPCDHPRGDAIVSAGRDHRPIVTEQLAEARGLGHGFLLRLSASACRREW
jgi:hypothetical protein